jgi:hypothetical protein
MHSFTYDETKWPLVQVAAPTGAPTSGSHEAHLARLAGLLSRRSAFAIVVDLGSTGGLDVAQRERMRRFVREHNAELREFVRGVGIVTRSRFQRALVTTVEWLARPPCAIRVFEAHEDALAWARARITRGHAPIG